MSDEVTPVPLDGVEIRPGEGHFGVYDHGAHVWAWQPDGQRPVLWMSAQSMLADGQPIRGGVPVVFPWFGTGPAGDRTPRTASLASGPGVAPLSTTPPARTAGSGWSCTWTRAGRAASRGFRSPTVPTSE
ncbi:MAG TPA: hypothetical protein VGK53_23240 [Propionicimonas sp.]|jgi:hypothetical protein